MDYCSFKHILPLACLSETNKTVLRPGALLLMLKAEGSAKDKERRGKAALKISQCFSENIAENMISCPFPSILKFTVFKTVFRAC